MPVAQRCASTCAQATADAVIEISSTVIVAATADTPASPYDLTDLATARDELGIAANDTSQDTFLQRAITQASVAIANYCNRTFALEVVEDRIQIEQDAYPYQLPGGVNPLALSRWPLVKSASVSFTGATHRSPVIDGIASTAGVKKDTLIFASDDSLPAGTTIDTVSLYSLVLSKSATSATAGLTFTTGIQVVQTLGAGNTRELIFGTDYAIDEKRGWLSRLNSWKAISVPWESQPLTVRYQAGYETIPADLVDACLRLVTARFKARGRDPMLVERSQPQSLGSERFWVGVQPGQSGALPPEIASLVDQYRVPVVA